MRTKLPVPAFAVKLIESHSQSLPTLPVATFQDGDTIILDDHVIDQFVIVNRFDRTGIDDQKSISSSVRAKLPPAAFSVVPVNERLVPRVISSITHVPAVPRHISLLVVIDVVMVRSADRSPPQDIGHTTLIVLDVGVISASVIAVLNCERVPVIPTILV